MADNSADSGAGQRWTWWSTHESIAAEVPSVWGIVETALAVAAYWFLAIWLGTYAFLFAGVVIAPMVLLRSDASVALGLQWFKRVDEHLDGRDADSRRWIETTSPYAIFALWVLLVSGLFALVGLDGFKALFGFVFGLAFYLEGGDGVVVVAVATIVGVAILAFWILAAATGLAGAIFLSVSSAGIRMLATLRHLPEGVSSMPRNFRRLALSTSPRQMPELVPGIATTDSKWRFDSVLQIVNRNRGQTRCARYPDRGKRVTEYIPELIIARTLLLAYLPAWFYRVSIKSTAWFWWPLAYIGREPREARDPEHMRRLVLGSPFRRLGRWIAIASLLAFAILSAWDHFRTNGFDLPPLPTQTLVIGFVLTRLAEVPWQVAGLLSAVSALLAGIWTGHAAISLKYAKDIAVRDAASRQFPWIERLVRFGFVCTVLYWLGLGGHLALYANSQRCWIDPPSAVTGWAKKFYGDLAPPPPRCLGA